MPRTAAPKKSSALAKLTRPRLFDAFPRKRLFKLLDAQRRHPVIWIAGPPGAGKTTLVATWLEARKLPGIWYQVDGGDADPATFFYYLREAATILAAKRRNPLPLMTPEYMPDLSGFSRRWFRKLFTHLSHPITLVLDNYQEVPEESNFHRVIEAAANEIPKDAHLIVVSRAEPPAVFARLLASERVGQVSWDELRLTPDEASGIGAGKEPLAEGVIRELHRECDGWAAGFTLMREHAQRTGVVTSVAHADSMENVFNYFASQILDQISVMNRDILIRTAFLPRFTVALAETISGSASAGKLLEYLYRRHLFTDRRTGEDDTTYQYHALFRAFLQTQARQLYTPLGLAQLTSYAASLLRANGQADDAIALYLEARDWRAAGELILELAPNLVVQGRGQSLREWVAVLPQALSGAAPWLSYWVAASLIGVSLQQARSAFEQAYKSFVACGDKTGQTMTAAGVLETYYFEAHDFNPTDKWIAIVAQLLCEKPSFTSVEAEARVYAASLGAMFWRQPDHPLVFTCLDHVMSLLRREMDPTQKVATACFVSEFLGIAGYPEQADQLIQLVAPEFKKTTVLPLYRAAWLARLTHHQQYCLAAFDDARKGLDEALAIATENGFHFLLNVIHGLRSESELALGNLPAAESTLEQMRTSLPREGRRAIGRYHNLYANVALIRGDLELALQHAETAFAIGQESGGTLLESFFGRTLVMVLLERGELDRAEALLGVIRRVFHADRYPALGRQVQFFDASLAALRGDWEDCHRILRAALGESKKAGYLNLARLVINPRICNIALQAGIEVDYIQRIIRKQGMLPPSRDTDNWPWPVRVYTLGAFRVEIAGAAPASGRKVARKPLDLLKALVAFGGRNVSTETLANALWPDADAAEASTGVTLLRLRKLLGDEQAITLRKGKLSLDDRRVWVDIWSLERQLDALEAKLRNAANDDAEVAHLGQQVLDLYRGHFLADDAEQPWMLAMRERLRSRALRVWLALGMRQEQAGRWDEAAVLYQRGSELDSLAEEFYRRLMICHRAQGRYAEALSVYRRCRDMLSIVLGVKPSAETEDIKRSVTQA